MAVSKCDTCKFMDGDYAVFDQNGQGHWWTPFCCKGHWQGDDSDSILTTSMPQEYNPVWDDCPDFETQTG